MLIVLVMKYGGIISINGFNTAHYERIFQPLWFDAVGIILTGIGVLLFISSIKRAKYGT
jgi:hypothetical protein